MVTTRSIIGVSKHREEIEMTKLEWKIWKAFYREFRDSGYDVRYSRQQAYIQAKR